MNAVKTLALVASSIGFASISLPAHSQQVDRNQAAQIAIVTGNNNVVNQTNILVIVIPIKNETISTAQI